MNQAKVRIDKWLWAARFFKTRSQASQAVTGGKVHVNGARVKPARAVELDDELRIQKGPYEFVVIVRGLSGQRRGAPEARKLYEETEESLVLRDKTREERRLFRAQGAAPPTRPSKRDRRKIKKFTRKDF
jgi:ribosome-associated heat shock protein Hsp15